MAPLPKYSGATHVIEAVPADGKAATTERGAVVVPATTSPLRADAALAPLVFVAFTLSRYEVLLTSPVTVQVRAVPKAVQVRPPGVAVTV